MNLKVITLICLASSKHATAYGSCEIFTLKEKPVCLGEIKCYRAIDDISHITEYWNCVPKDNFRLHLVLEDIKKDLLSDTSLHDDFTYDQIEKLNLNDHEALYDIPLDVYYLFNGLITIDLSRNAFQNVNLDVFTNYLSLKTIDLSYNNITEFDRSVKVRATPKVNVISYIDLSHNKINILLDEIFTPFKRLHTLNLSCNVIKALDELSFLGLDNLELLDLSYNKISQTMLSLTPLVKLKNLYLQHNEIVSILDLNVNTLKSIEIIDFSSNKIKYIEDSTFKNLKKLYSVNLYNNTDCVNNGALNLLPFDGIVCNKL